jgi:hypothetical protein
MFPLLCHGNEFAALVLLEVWARSVVVGTILRFPAASIAGKVMITAATASTPCRISPPER